MITLLIVRAPEAVLATVTGSAVLVVPTSWLPKLRLVGDTLTVRIPVPLRLTVWGLLLALSVKVSVPV
jgi:hypothetical protein